MNVLQSGIYDLEDDGDDAKGAVYEVDDADDKEDDANSELRWGCKAEMKMLWSNNDEGGGKSKYKREGLNKNCDLKLITEWTEDLGKLMQLQCQNGADG